MAYYLKSELDVEQMRRLMAEAAKRKAILD
jgi:hypothetical protein